MQSLHLFVFACDRVVYACLGVYDKIVMLTLLQAVLCIKVTETERKLEDQDKKMFTL